MSGKADDGAAAIARLHRMMDKLPPGVMERIDATIHDLVEGILPDVRKLFESGSARTLFDEESMARLLATTIVGDSAMRLSTSARNGFLRAAIDDGKVLDYLAVTPDDLQEEAAQSFLEAMEGDRR